MLFVCARPVGRAPVSLVWVIVIFILFVYLGYVMFYFMYVVVGMYAYLLWFMGCFTYYFAFGVFYWGISSIYIY